MKSRNEKVFCIREECGSNQDNANPIQSIHVQHANRGNINGNRGSSGHAFRGNENSRGNGNIIGNGYSRGNYANRRHNINGRGYSNTTTKHRDGYLYSNDAVGYREGYTNGIEQNGNSANEYIPTTCYRCHGEGHIAYQCPTGRPMGFMDMAPTRYQQEEK